MTDDNLHELAGLLVKIGAAVPAYVTDAANGNHFPSGKWAHPAREEFAVDTPAQTWLSSVLMYGRGKSDPLMKIAEARLLDAAAGHGIYDDVMSIKTACLNARNPATLSDDDFAVVVTQFGEKIRRYPLNTPENIKTAAASFVRDRFHFGFPVRVKAASRILSAVDRAGVDVGDGDLEYLEKAAMLAPASPAAVVDRLRYRSERMPGVAIEAMFKIAENAGLVNQYGQFAGMLADVEEGIHSARKAYLSGGVQLPEEVFFRRRQVKVASDASVVEICTGDKYKIEDLVKVGSAPFSAVNPAYAESLTGADGRLSADFISSVLPTMPADDAFLLRDALGAAGVRPSGITKLAARSADEFTDEGIEKFLRRNGRKPVRAKFMLETKATSLAGV